jgi:hypothetical protein
MLRRFHPLNGVDTEHAFIAYTLRRVRGSRTFTGSLRYSWQVLGWLALLCYVPLALWLLLYKPGPYDDFWQLQSAWVYTSWIFGLAANAQPLADLVAIFYSANAIASEQRSDVHFDLLRIAPMSPERYVNHRLALAKARAWRLVVISWGARVVSWTLLVLVASISLIVLFIEAQPINYADILDAWLRILAVLFLGGGFFFIASIFWLLEPLWRFELFANVTAGTVARRNGSAWRWPMLGAVIVGVYIAQSAFMVGYFVAVTYGSMFFYRFMQFINNNTFIDMSQDMRDILLTFIVLLFSGFMLYRFRRLQLNFADLRRRMAVDYMFRAVGGDAFTR